MYVFIIDNKRTLYYYKNARYVLFLQGGDEMTMYRNVSVGFWEDDKVLENFTPEDRYFYLYLITNPHGNICGCFELKRRYLELEFGYTWENVLRLVSRMQDEHDVIRYDENTKEVLILNWGRYNWGSSPKVKSSVLKYMNGIKSDEFREYVKKAVEEKEFTAPSRREITAATQTATPIGTQPVKITQLPGPRGHASDNPGPKLEEVKAYIKEKGYEMSTGSFFFYMQHNEWKDSNGNEIKNWKSYLDKCEENGQFRGIDDMAQ